MHALHRHARGQRVERAIEQARVVDQQRRAGRGSHGLERCMPSAPPLDPGPMPTAKRPSRFRLAPDVRPTRLRPPPRARPRRRRRFRGEVRIDVASRAPARGDRPARRRPDDRARRRPRSSGQVVPLRVRLDRHDETVSLRAARPLPAGAARARTCASRARSTGISAGSTRPAPTARATPSRSARRPTRGASCRASTSRRSRRASASR